MRLFLEIQRTPGAIEPSKNPEESSLAPKASQCASGMAASLKTITPEVELEAAH
jgi:hypothetical protein